MVTDAELIDQITARRTTINALEAAEAEAMVEYVDRARAAGERLGGEVVGRLERDAACHELSMARRLPVKVITDQVCCARRVRSTMPLVWSAWHDGLLSTLHVRRIDAAALRLRRGESVTELDETVVDVAVRKTPSQLGSWLDRFVERIEADSARERHEMSMRDRHVRVQHVGDGMAYVTAFVSSLAAAAIETRLDSEARSVPSADPRSFEQRRADFFVDLLLGRADAEGGCSTTVGITVPLSSLMGFSNQPGEFADRSASIPAHVVRAAMLQPGSLLYRLVTDDVGNILTATSLGRFAPEQLKQVLAFRDGTSVFPTSTVPARSCDYDHTEAWPAPTEAANLGPLNRRAHRLKTEGLLSVRQTRPGLFEWRTRTGHTYSHTADPLPIAGWDAEPPIWAQPEPPEWPDSPQPLADVWEQMHAAA